MSRIVLQPAEVRLRHIIQGGGPGAVTVLGASYVPQPREGVNGGQGFQGGSFELRLGEEGGFSLTFANAAGGDGALHRDRFRILNSGKGRYKPGDEWIEIYIGRQLKFVGTPTKATVTRGQIEISGTDALPLLQRTRENQVGFWHHAPRDAFEHYTGAWRALIADDFTAVTRSDRGVAGAAAVTAGRASTGPGQTGTVSWIHDPSLMGRSWRVDVIADVPDATQSTGGFPLSISIADTYFSVFADRQALFQLAAAGSGVFGPRITLGQQSTFTIEARDGWRWLTIDGKVIAVIPANYPRPQPGTALTVQLGQVVTVRQVLLRGHEPLLRRGADRGDARLPGLPTTGGLAGHYYSGSEESQYVWPLASPLTLAPHKDEIASRLDSTPYFPLVTSATWQPPGVSPNHFGARWTGAIHLDLAAHDYALQITAGDVGRVWVGRTWLADCLAESSLGAPGTGTISQTTPGLRSMLGTESGWYPIVIEYTQQRSSARSGLTVTMSTDGGGFAAIGPSLLSPYGCFTQQVRNESHYDQVKAIADTFGYQFTVKPRALESGEFPGALVPRVRVGRDTDYVLGSDDATDMSVSVDAEQSADAIQADAAGLADTGGAVQLTAEEFLFDEVAGHMLIVQDSESLSDITEPALLAQRLSSLLALRAAPWEEVNARPPGFRELRDSFPLTGQLAEFDWAPGDGIRLRLPELGVEDPSPRQITGVTREFNPAGVKPPVAAFRQRPRRFRDTLRQLKRLAVVPQRYFQGQIAAVASELIAGPGTAQIVLPPNLSRVLSATVTIAQTADPATTWDVFVNDSASATLTGLRVGHYDFVPAVAPLTIGERRMTVRLAVGQLGGLAGCQFNLQLVIEVRH